ncbi:prepilin-type N-terminal cleavage/methylation domain-containing protein [Rheinheimera sp.]|uniref:prepilin-type N-terminal cleavage/methylation domain-containing protein n=1 Tax=Rheinheimera sp. TaxID=1869214 RepID=UPI0040479F12
MKTNKGFTLVELIIVIVILGILAVTAAPRFLNLAGDAKGETLQAVKASLQSANSIINAKAIIQGVQTAATANVNESGTDIPVVFGYVAAEEDAVKDVLDLDSNFVVVQGVANAALSMTADDVMIYPTGSTPPTATTTTAEACVLVYTEAASATTKPTYAFETDGC